MAEALSQSQIDELLNKMRSGGIEEVEEEACMRTLHGLHPLISPV